MKKSFIWLSTLALCGLSWLWLSPAKRPNSYGIHLELTPAENTQKLPKADLIWLMDCHGQMASSNGQVLWPDLLEHLLSDEALEQKPRVQLCIDQRCSFGHVAQVLQLCAKYQAHVQLQLEPKPLADNLSSGPQNDPISFRSKD